MESDASLEMESVLGRSGWGMERLVRDSASASTKVSGLASVSSRPGEGEGDVRDVVVRRRRVKRREEEEECGGSMIIRVR